MSKAAVLVTRKMPPEVEARLVELFDARLNPDDHAYDRESLIAACEGMAGVMPCHTERFDAEVIRRLPESVRVIANVSVGVDHVDLEAARARGLVVTNTPDVLNDATIEIALLLMLGAARRAAEGERLVRNREWRDWSPAFMVGTQVTGKRLGIIGMGRVGQVMARRAARGLDMQVHYYNRHRLAPEREQGAIYHASLDEMLPVCDFLSLHCPATAETRGLLDARRIALLPRGAIVVNTARGAVVDDDALIEALRSGHLAAAGLDVYNGEPDIDPRYRELWNTFLLPHIGSATRETRIAMGMRAVENLHAVLSGREAPDRVA